VGWPRATRPRGDDRHATHGPVVELVVAEEVAAREVRLDARLSGVVGLHLEQTVGHEVGVIGDVALAIDMLSARDLDVTSASRRISTSRSGSDRVKLVVRSRSAVAARLSARSSRDATSPPPARPIARRRTVTGTSASTAFSRESHRASIWRTPKAMTVASSPKTSPRPARRMTLASASPRRIAVSTHAPSMTT